ncbi:MAG: FAD-dependent oxidoreductase, partial [Ginsengibacter sp.]
MQKFDVIVIGTGSGSGVAKRCAKEGKKVAIIDYHPFGGTCPLRGCMPKKTLEGVARLLALNEQLLGKGITKVAKASWKDLIKFKNTITEPKSQDTIDSLKKAGITIFHGKAKIIDENSIQVNDHILHGEKFVFANGSAPTKLSIPGEDLLIDSTEFMDMEK